MRVAADRHVTVALRSASSSTAGLVASCSTIAGALYEAAVVARGAALDPLSIQRTRTTPPLAARWIEGDGRRRARLRLRARGWRCVASRRAATVVGGDPSDLRRRRASDRRRRAGAQAVRT
ncbi:MAG: hypothetical protein H6982_06955 [Chromatiales bacterium]|nr:hypothetical protein [Chromatiales bacterium]